ncbi:carbohydrate-binding family 9-like protein [Bacteroides sp. 224]|uniref:carbohydrate-binding family 9-like protein n=1 Tax=Bacteroides sp. 224 TaxID=2302936 RepID=UPI0013D638F8|nr:carbohydrate-binding family 9-like protein [Bacteroides sp. 224]NDV67096.1 hypothetical protein [Bacteroides sp. 224]
MKVTKISVSDIEPEALPALLDKENIAFQPIDVVNWEEYPYRPEVTFRIAYTDHAILLHYKVKEATVRARYATDNEAVWTDSCVEFFINAGQDAIYYNLECNCIGTVLLGVGSGRGERERANPHTMKEIKRWASLGNQPFEERKEETAWEVALIIPYRSFFKHQIPSLEGKTIRANFYKCGDELETPHFLSWNPMDTPAPDFHRPSFFGTLLFS